MSGAPVSEVSTLDPDRSLVLIRVEWHDATPSPEPWLRVRQGRDPSFLISATGVELSYRVESTQPVRCVGRPGFRSGEPPWIDCNSDLQGGGKLCVKCKISEANFASSLHHAHRSLNVITDPEVANHLDQANCLYLAAFRDGTVKVGTSTLSRREIRWSEQGAWQAIQVAETADGVAVRHLEELVSDDLAIPQSVSGSRKLAGLINPVSEQILASTLTEKANDAVIAISNSAHPATIRHVNWSFPNRRDPAWQSLLSYSNPLERGSHQFILDRLCGRMASATKLNSGDRFAIDLGRIYGLVLKLGRFEVDELHIQNSLF